jgi:prolyl-tRNA editing enzyme YbaK/EbsC (Cys-tRNA(Pro) deacylase)
MRNLPRLVLAGLALHLAAPLAAASDGAAPSPQMTVADFLERVGTLAKTGPEWTLSPEASQLFAAISQTGKAYRQTLAERRAAGQPVEACLPETAEIDSDALFAHLAGYSAEAARKTSIAEAFAALVRQRFPCP